MNKVLLQQRQPENLCQTPKSTYPTILTELLNIKQDSRLRGNDSMDYFSGCHYGFAKIAA